MRKSLLLASACLSLTALTTTAFAQDNTPTEGANTAQSSAAGSVDQGQTGADAGEIIVTATRRAQALTDVPIAVSAVSAEQLQNSGATDIRALNQLSPSLLVSSTSSEAGAGVARIRGIGTVGDNPGLESSVAVFIDGVYRSRTGSGLTELGEIERIEVLRGPQGTLFGRNASAGLINVVTKKPEFEVGGSAALTYGNYDYIRAEASVTGPVIGDTVAARIDGVYVERDGFLKDVVSGRRVNDRDRYLVRGQLLIEPNDDLEIRLIGDYADRNEECCGATYLPTRDVRLDANGGLVFSPSRVRRIMESGGGIINDDTFSRRIAITPGRDYVSNVEDWGLSAEANWDFGDVNLTSITAYRDWKLLSGQDADFNNLDILYRASDGGNTRRFETFSQELRLQGTLFDDKLDWLVGGYFANEKLTLTDNIKYGNDYERFASCRLIAGLTDQGIPAAAFDTSQLNCINQAVVRGTIAALPAGSTRSLLQALIANPARPGFGSIAAALGQPTLQINNTGAVNNTFEQESRNWALFTHNVFNVTDALSLTLGVRYTEERKTLDASLNANDAICTLIRNSPLVALQALPCVINSTANGTYTSSDPGGKRKESEWSGTAVLSYKVTDDVLTYASYSKGYKAGGFNLDSSSLDVPNAAAAAARPAGQAYNGRPELSDLQFAPEKVDAYEIGVKYDGGAFNLNVAAFYQAFKNFQLNTYTGTNFIVDNINSCSDDLNGLDQDNASNSLTGESLTGACTGGLRAGVISKGVEVEALMFPSDDLTVTAGFTLSDTQYRDDLVGAGGRPLPTPLFNLPGKQLSNAPKYVVSGSAAYERPVGNSGLTSLLYADFRYQSEINTGSDLDYEKLQEGVFVVNARIGLYGEDKRWGIELWAQNLLDTDYQQVAFDSPVQGGGTGNTGISALQSGFYRLSDAMFSTFLAEPRTYGITVRTRF